MIVHQGWLAFSLAFQANPKQFPRHPRHTLILPTALQDTMSPTIAGEEAGAQGSRVTLAVITQLGWTDPRLDSRKLWLQSLAL